MMLALPPPDKDIDENQLNHALSVGEAYNLSEARKDYEANKCYGAAVNIQKAKAKSDHAAKKCRDAFVVHTNPDYPE